MADTTDIEYLKRITHSAVHVNYTDSELSDMIDEHDVRGAARRLWEERVAQTAGFVDIKEGSSTRELSQEHEHAKAMLTLYGGPIGGDDPGSRQPARVHRIKREAVDQD